MYLLRLEYYMKRTFQNLIFRKQLKIISFFLNLFWETKSCAAYSISYADCLQKYWIFSDSTYVKPKFKKNFSKTLLFYF